MTIRFHLKSVAAVGLVACAAWAAPSAQAATVEEIANYKGPDRQAFLEAGAKKEGALLLYAVATQLKPIMDRFREKYPYIKLEIGRSDSANVARRIVEEDKAGRHEADGFELTSVGLLVIRQAGLLQPFYSPQMEAIEKVSIESGRNWVSARESYGGLGYNTNIVPPAEAPKTWQDLLNPQYKGKMGVTGSASNAGNWIGVLYINYGEDFIRKLGAQEVRVYKASSRAVANLTVAGEVPISARASNAHFANSIRKGAAVAWVEPGPMAVSDNSVAVLKKAPHPHAMMLMVDFLLSKEGQEMYAKIGYASARTDMPGEIKPKQKVYLEHRPNVLSEFDHWVAMFNKYFKVRA